MFAEYASDIDNIDMQNSEFLSNLKTLLEQINDYVLCQLFDQITAANSLTKMLCYAIVSVN